MFGAGYAGAEDRLFFMDVLRNAGRGQLSLVRRRRRGQPRDGPRHVGARALHRGRPPAPVRHFDDESTAPRAEASRTTSTTTWPASTPTSPRRALNPLLMPGEYVGARQARGPDDWQVTDVIATATLVGAIFGKGGGGELGTALAYQAPRKRFGRKSGPQVWQRPARGRGPRSARRPCEGSASPTRPRRRSCARAASRCPTAARSAAQARDLDGTGERPSPAQAQSRAGSAGSLALPRADVERAAGVRARVGSPATRSPSSGPRPATSPRRS